MKQGRSTDIVLKAGLASWYVAAFALFYINNILGIIWVIIYLLFTAYIIILEKMETKS